MAFDVTPTSGEAPYTFTANVENATLIDGVLYSASVMYSTSSESCPLVGNSTAWSSEQVNNLIFGDSRILNQNVNPNTCRTFTLEILRVSDSTVVASSNVSISNL